MHVWDTGGSERFRAMTKLYYRDANAAIVTFDIGDERSFESVHHWVSDLS